MRRLRLLALSNCEAILGVIGAVVLRIVGARDLGLIRGLGGRTGSRGDGSRFLPRHFMAPTSPKPGFILNLGDVFHECTICQGSAASTKLTL